MTVEEDVKADETTPRSASEESASRPDAGARRASCAEATPLAATPRPTRSATRRASRSTTTSDHDRRGRAHAARRTQRFVYAAYFAGAIAIALHRCRRPRFRLAPRSQTYKPSIGEPRDEIVMPLAAVDRGAAPPSTTGTGRAPVSSPKRWRPRCPRSPGRAATEVTNGTFVVIVTTIVSTVFFALMDKFWGFVTNLVYGGT